MYRLAFVLSSLTLFSGGCGIALAPHYRMNVRGLVDPEHNSDNHGGVVVAAASITRKNWREHHGAVAHLEWMAYQSGMTASGPSGTFGMGTGGALSTNGGALTSASQSIDSADVALVPLPSFQVRIVNASAQPISMAKAEVVLHDENGRIFPWLRTREEITSRAESEVLTNRPVLREVTNRRARDYLEQSLREIPLLTSEINIPAGGDWEGYASFDFTARDGAEMVAFMMSSRKLTLEIANLAPDGAPLSFNFTIERRAFAAGVMCPDHKRRAQVSDCPDTAEAIAPVDEGPCIQHTKKPRTIADTQWWMGGTPIANSDLHRTLLSEPLTEGPMKRGLYMRAIGYSLIGLGIMGTAIGAPVFAAKLGNSWGPVGVSFLGISAVGLVVAIIGSRQSDRAIRLYNEQSEATGLCAPIW